MSVLLKRRHFLRLAAIGTGAAALAACQATPAPAPAAEVTTAATEAVTAAPPATEARVELRVSHWWGDRLDTMMKAFTDANPNVDLKPEPKPWQGYHDALLTQLAGAVGADVYLVSMAYFPQIVRKGAFRSIDEYMSADNFDPKAEFVIDPYLAYGYKGELYALDAWLPGSVYIVCNLDLFEEAGVECPKWGSDSFDQWKFADLREAALALTKKGADGRTEQWGLSNPGSWQDANNQYAWQNGGDWFDTPNYQDETKCIIDSPECIEAYEFVVDMHLKDGATPSATEAQLLGDNIFLSGKIGMVHTWMIYANFKDATFEWSVIPIPWQTKKAAKMGGGNQWSVYTDSKVGDAAWGLIKFLTTDYDAFKEMVHIVMPPSKPERFLDLLEPKERECWEVQLARTIMDNWKPANWGSRAPSRYNDIYVAWMDRVYQEEITVKEALTGIADETNKLIDELIAEGS